MSYYRLLDYIFEEKKKTNMTYKMKNIFLKRLLLYLNNRFRHVPIETKYRTDFLAVKNNF